MFKVGDVRLNMVPLFVEKMLPLFGEKMLVLFGEKMDDVEFVPLNP